MRASPGNPDGLETVFLIDRIRQATGLGRLPVDRLIGERNALRLAMRHSRRGLRRPVDIGAHGPGRGGRGHGHGDGRVDRRAGREMLGQPSEKRGDVRRDAGRGRERGRIVRRQLVDDGEPRRDGRAVLGIDRPVDRGGEDDAAAFLQTGIGRGPGRCVRREIRPGDRHQPAAGRKARQRRGDMAEGGVGHAALDIRHHRKRRVHENDGRKESPVEVIVDLGRVEARDGKGRKEVGEKIGAGVGQLVEQERAAGDLGQDGEKPGSGRGLQHAVGRRDGCGERGCQAERDRGGELLEGLRLLGAARMRRHQAGDLGKLRQDRGGGAGLAEKRLSVFAQHEDGRDLAGFVGGLPVPGAGSVGAAEGGFHRAAQHGGVDALAAFEVRKEDLRGNDDRRGRGGRSDGRKRCGDLGGRGCGYHVHDGEPRESGRKRAAQRSLSTAPAQIRPGPSLPLTASAKSPRAAVRRRRFPAVTSLRRRL